MVKPMSICLNMIVKNETPVLDRLIKSVKDVIDYYVIVDTGSTDGTPEFIKKRMREYGVDGEVISEPWVNFSVNRNSALQHACARRNSGWLLFIDADEELQHQASDFYRRLQPGITYCLRKRNQDISYALPNLIDISANRWQWQGAVHEYLEHLEGSGTREVIEDAWIYFYPGEGARSRDFTAEQKFLRDAALLEEELKKNPADARSQFYLAQSYRDAGHYESAYRHYCKRAAMPGWVEETFFAQLQSGYMAEQLNLPYATVMEAYQKAYEFRPSRAESLHALAFYCRQKEQFNLACLFAKRGLEIPYSNDTLFVNPAVYQWRLLDEYAVSAYWAGHYQESRGACEEIFRREAVGVAKLSPQDSQRIRENLNFALGKL